MSTATWILVSLAIAATVSLIVGDWRRRSGRGAPLSRVRTGVRRRAPRGADATEATSLLAAGFAAHVIGPLLARASASARRADTAKARLERRLDGEHRVRHDLDTLVAHLGDHYDGVRPTNPRWHRYAFYALVMVVDVATGMIIARGLNLGGGEIFGFGASAGMFLFFVGKMGGTGLRRLDLGPTRVPRTQRSDQAVGEQPGPSPTHPDIGKPWVSAVMIAMSVVGIVVFIAGLTASRQVAQAITTAASNASALAQGGSGQAVVVLPAVPWWQTALSSAVALGSFAATAFLALRNHPVTRRIEELELRIKRRTKEASKAVRPLGAATAVSSRNLALLDAAMAELGSRLDITQDIGIVPAFARICTDIDQLHERQRVCVEAFDAASDPTPLELDSSDSAPGGDATSGAEQPDVIDLAGDGRLVRPAVSASNSGTTR